VGQFSEYIRQNFIFLDVLRYFFATMLPFNKVSKLRIQRSTTTFPETYDVEVWTKEILKVSGRRRVDLTVRVMKDGVEDKELQIYKTIVEDIKIYLEEKYFMNFQPIPKCIAIISEEEMQAEEDERKGRRDIFMIENKRHLGFEKDRIKNKEGLDYEHSVIVIAALATFHATSYCFRKHGEVAMVENYPVLREELAFPDVLEETIKLLGQLCKKYPEYEKCSHIFIAYTNKEKQILHSDLECFGVLSHGYFCRENLLFKYKSNQDSMLSCSDVIFQDLSRCHYGSCVLDLLQFIFTSIDPQVRHNFMADFVCSVYYDNFSKTVYSINSKIVMFSQKEFIKEFNNNIMYGFFFSAEVQTLLYLEVKDNSEDEDVSAKIDEKYEEYIIAFVRDVLHFMMCAKATII
jgi:hypothetical protein